MRGITRTQKLDVAQYYVLGHSYKEIEGDTGISHGSVVNIVKELEEGRLTIPGTSFDEVDDLRQLSADLKKKGLQPSQALHGLILYRRLRELAITPELLQRWSELVVKHVPLDFPISEFIEAAVRLNELENQEGKPFNVIVEEYVKLKEGIESSKSDLSLEKDKSELIGEIKPLHTKIKGLKKTKNGLETDIDVQTRKLKEIKLKIKELERGKTRLDKETKDLQRKKAKLSSEVDSKNQTLSRLNEIGLSDEDLLRIRDFVERTGESEGITGYELKEKFFSTLVLYKDICGLEKRRETETQEISELLYKKYILSGEIIKLEKNKGLLEGEIKSIISFIVQNIKDVGEEAALEIQRQVTDIRSQIDILLADALKAGKVIGDMAQVIKKGKESERSVDSYMKEVRGMLRSN